MHELRATLANGDSYFKEDHIYDASEDFFKIFSFKLIRGVDSLVLKEPFKIVLSGTLAKKYFGDQDPVGRILKINGKKDYEVTGVFEDVPENSHMKFDALISFSTWLSFVKPNDLNSYQWDGFMTYIRLDDKSDPKVFESKLPAFVEKGHGEELKKYNAGMVFHLEPITDIHLYSNNLMMEFGPNGNGKGSLFSRDHCGLYSYHCMDQLHQSCYRPVHGTGPRSGGTESDGEFPIATHTAILTGIVSDKSGRLPAGAPAGVVTASFLF